MSAIPPPNLRLVRFVRQMELADPTGKLLTLENRETASARSGVDFDNPALSTLESRATLLLKSAPDATRAAANDILQQQNSYWRFAPWILCGGALLFGWVANELGAQRTINILAFPLLGLILWNVFVCGIAFWHEIRKKAPSPTPALPPLPLALKNLENSVQREILQEAWSRFQTDELRETQPKLKARWKLCFHLAALLLAVGVVAGMYAQGLYREYLASWESTFLNESGVKTFLTFALSPAAWLTGISLPDLETLRQMRINPVPAAPYIHLWAASAFIFIGIPRTVLFLLAKRQQRGPSVAESDLSKSLADGLRPPDATAAPAAIIPVFHGLENSNAEAIRGITLSLWGGRKPLEFLPTMEIGVEAAFLEAHPLTGRDVVAVVSFSATPETEVHGALLQQLAKTSHRLLVIADALAFEDRHGAMPEFARRFEQRKAAWQRMLPENQPLLVLTKAGKEAPDRAAREFRNG
jgi:hypothetical protein